jgi:hypothetical protein
MTTAAHQHHGAPLPAAARALRAAFERTARERPDLASELPWTMFEDPGELARLAQLDADAERITAALRAGISPASLGLVEDGLAQVLGEHDR